MTDTAAIDMQILWYEAVKADIWERRALYTITSPRTAMSQKILSYCSDILVECDAEIAELTEQRLALPAERKSYDQEQAAHLRDGA